MERAVYNCLTKPRVANDVAICTFDLTAFTVQENKLVKHKVEKRFFEKAVMDQNRYISIEAAVNHNKDVEDAFLPQIMYLLRSSCPTTDISDD